jgi:hypothetical protein
MAKFRVGLGEPGYQKIKSAFPGLRTNQWAPALPIFDQAAKADHFDNLFIRRVFEQSPGCPILIQPAKGLLSS